MRTSKNLGFVLFKAASWTLFHLIFIPRLQYCKALISICGLIAEMNRVIGNNVGQERPVLSPTGRKVLGQRATRFPM